MKAEQTKAVLNRCVRTGLKAAGRAAALLRAKAGSFFRRINPGP